MKLIQVLKGQGYNPYRGAGGRFASGGHSKSPSVRDMDPDTHQYFQGASNFSDGSRPIVSAGYARGFSPKGWQVGAMTVASPEGIQVHISDTEDGYIDSPGATRQFLHPIFQPQGGRSTNGMSRGFLMDAMKQFPRNWTPKLLRRHGFVEF